MRKRAAESRADFIHKIRSALMELRESRSWLRLILRTESVPEARISDLLDECVQLGNILGPSAATANSKKRNA